MGQSAPLPSEPLAPVVLVVDDDPLVCHMMARMLSAEHEVVEAHDGQQALALVSTLQVEAVVSDMGMPGMSGEDLCARIAERRPTLPVLLVSGGNAGPSDHPIPFVAKPFTAEALVAAVRAILPGHATVPVGAVGPVPPAREGWG
jgi:CheY-like chemotaxis protein